MLMFCQYDCSEERCEHSYIAREKWSTMQVSLKHFTKKCTTDLSSPESLNSFSVDVSLLISLEFVYCYFQVMVGCLGLAYFPVL